MRFMLRNSADHWGWPAKLLHWLAAALILILLVHGWWMTHMIARPDRLANYTWHAAVGYDLLALSVLRLLWRWFNPVPAQPADSKPWEKFSAHAGHFGLYVLMFVVSLTGWALAGTFRVPMNMDLLGITVPAIITGVARPVRELIEDAHKILAYVLAALVLVHFAGALRHHFLKRNDVLMRMLWGA
jgi:cytochrome b561